MKPISQSHVYLELPGRENNSINQLMNQANYQKGKQVSKLPTNTDNTTKMMIITVALKFIDGRSLMWFFHVRLLGVIFLLGVICCLLGVIWDLLGTFIYLFIFIYFCSLRTLLLIS